MRRVCGSSPVVCMDSVIVIFPKDGNHESMRVMKFTSQPKDISGVGSKSMSEMATSQGGGKGFSNIQE